MFCLLMMIGGCGKVAGGKVVNLAAGGRVKTLDPALADDLASRNMVAAFYDTLLEYEYLDRPYRLAPSMLAAMPEVSGDGLEYRFRLRDDLYFADDGCFAGGVGRKVTAADVVFSLKRLADVRLHSPAYWMVRGKVAGLDEFRKETETAAPGNLDIYDREVPGLRAVNDRELVITLTRKDPRFLYLLAMPNCAVVPREAVAKYGELLGEHPVGSGPFRLREWIRDYKLALERNPNYREQYFAGAENPADRRKKLPLADGINCYQIRQPFSAWLLFLQGELDASVLDKDNLDLAAGGDRIAPALADRKLELIKAPEFEIRYIGFNCADPVLRNEKLRQAIALVFDVRRRIQHANSLLIAVEGPIPPGVAGFDPDLKNPYQANDLEKAKKLLAEAGYPGGIDPATGEPLELTFDQGNNTAAQRQLGELMAADLAKLGIRMVNVLNSTPRFIDKLRQGKTQLFRYSWVGDYPDAENFLQLFYSGNLGGCNRANFSDPEFDRMYRASLDLPDGPERTARYAEMARHVIARTPWIFEGMPIAYQLKYRWLENYRPHDFAFNRWKYFAVDPARREAEKKTFKPLSFKELQGK
ncbi:MAG: ABC transporter substrate-binding protein [Victivallaceae bacterium]